MFTIFISDYAMTEGPRHRRCTTGIRYGKELFRSAEEKNSLEVPIHEEGAQSVNHDIISHFSYIGQIIFILLASLKAIARSHFVLKFLYRRRSANNT